jgi:putative ABC transport system permease protein
MIKNYLKTALRNLLKHKVFSSINILGLAIGIAACLLIVQYVRFEWSYDDFHTRGERIYRMQLDRYNEGKISTQWAAGAAGIGNFAKNNLPEVEAFAKLNQAGGVFSYNENKFREKRVFYANDDFLKIFSYKLIDGKAAGALSEPNTAVITRSVARKLFGNENPIGKTISRNKNADFKITAIAEDMPENTHLKFDILLSFITRIQRSPDIETNMNWDGFFTYLLLKPGTDAKLVEKKLAALINKTYEQEFKAGNVGMIFHFQSLKDIHLYSNYMLEAEPNGNGSSVKFLLIIALFIIVIAWINYINLSTAKSIERAKEVGIRKVMGSYRSQLIGQFMMESILTNLFAVLLGFIIVIVSLPIFGTLTGKEISFSLLKDSFFWMGLIGLFLAGTFLSGLYPAFVLSSFRPILVLKGKLVKTRHGALLRQSLVVLQFAASVALIIGTFSVYRQLSFMRKQELGVNIDQTLVLTGPNVADSTYLNRLSSFKTELLRNPSVISVSASTEVPGNKVGWNAGGIGLVGGDPKATNQYRVIGIDYDFLNTFGLKVLKGRNFSQEYSTDPDAVLFNQTAVKLLGFNKPEEALNKRIEFWGHQYTIIGIVSDHHQESLKTAYDAHIFRLIPDSRNYYSVKIKAGADWSNIVKMTESKYNQIFAGNPFDYFFLNDYFDKQYQADKMFGRTFGVFAILAIFVSCLGLFGLASFVTTQRTKEIGIRKISGAATSSIVVLLTRDFLKPVLMSFVIAIPVTWYLLNKWLENYAFKMSVSPWIFILPAFLIIFIAIFTVSLQTVQAASANPVKSLRTE